MIPPENLPGVPADGDDGDDFEEEDWRAFRARLVMKERGKDCQPEPTEEFEAESSEESTASTKRQSSWAYDSGDSIEPGSVILNRPPKPDEDFGYGLGRQYLHKSVILILEHEDMCAMSERYDCATKGVILNRPTDLVLTDLYNGEDGAFHGKIWYGGNMHGIHTGDPKFYCLHSLTSKAAVEASREVIHGIQFTSLQNARGLVEDGLASSSDFWVFSGFVTWDGGELVEELREDSAWHAVSTDARTLRRGLRILSAGQDADPRDGGLKTWSMLMGMIQRGQEVSGREKEGETFDDLMLKEWAVKFLVFEEPPKFMQESLAEEYHPRPSTDLDGGFVRSTGSGVEGVRVGEIVRGSSALRSPFLLHYQVLHKSLILLIQDDEELSVGVVLNHPSTKVVDVPIADSTSSFRKRTVTLPLRYGGVFENGGDETILFLHMNPLLKEAQVGLPVGDDNGMWRCEMEEVSAALGAGIAMPEDFLAVKGFFVWPKENEGSEGGMREEVCDGHFEVVPQAQTGPIWRLLASQDLLSAASVDDNLRFSNLAWVVSGGESKERADIEEPGVSDEVEPAYVFKSSVLVSKLGDDALKTWVAAFLLDDPGVRP